MAHRQRPWRGQPLKVGFLVLVAALWLGGRANPAHAQKAEPTPAELKRAKKIITEAKRDKASGARHQKRKRTKQAMAAYRKAALGYLEAYMILEHQGLIFELAEIYRARGENAWALRGYKKYLAVAPDGSEVPAAQQAMKALTAELARADVLGDPDEAEVDIELDPTAVFGLDGEETRVEPEDEIEVEPDDEPDDEPEPVKPDKKKDRKQPERRRPGQMMRYAGIGTASLGVILLGTGVVYGIQAASASSSLSNNADGWTAEDRDLIARGESAENKMLVLSLLGAAALAGGGVIYYYGMQAGDRVGPRTTLVAPQLTPSSAALVFAGVF